MKKISFVAFLLVLALVFVSCGDTAATSSNDIASDTVSEYTSSEDTASEPVSSEEPSSEAPVSSEEPVVSEEPSIEDHPNFTKEYTVVQKTAAEKENIKRVKILVMGDSFTSGDGTPSAYRHALFTTLYEEGCYFEFVGDRKSSDIRLTAPYQAHMAAGGRTTPQLEETYKNAAANGKIKYDIALVLIGGNDFYGGKTADELFASFESLINTMLSDRPDATIFFSEMCRYGGIAENKIDDVNVKLEALIGELKAEGKKIEYIDLDQYVNFTSQADLMNVPPSGGHPSQQGNNKLGYAYGMAMKDTVLEMNKEKAPSGQKSVKDPDSVTLTKKEITLKINEQGSVHYQVAPTTADVNCAIWSSSDPSVATVNEYGVVTAHKAGTAVLTARVVGTNIKAECTVTVTNEEFKLTYAGKVETLYEPFNKRDKWEGDDKKIISSYLRKYYEEKVKVTSIDKYEISNADGSLTFLMLTSGHLGKTGTENFSRVKFGDYEFVSYNNMATIELKLDGEVIGTFEGAPYTFPRDRFTFNFIDQKVYVYRNNELIITANAPKKVYGTVEIENNGGGTFLFDELVIRTEAE